MLLETGANNWRLMFISGTVPALLFFILLFSTVRTPRWLMTKGYDRETSFVIRLVNPSADIDQLMKEIKTALMIDKKQQRIRILRKPYLKIVLIVSAVCMFNQLTGINLLVNYSRNFFSEAGLPPDPAFVTIPVIALTGLVFTIFSLFLVDRVGRKPLLKYGSSGMAVIALLTGILFLAGSISTILLIILILIATGFFAATQGIVLWVYITEMLPDRIRARAASLAFSTYWLFNLGTTLLSFLVSGIGTGILLLVFSVMTFTSIFFFRKYLIETNGKSLEAQDEKLTIDSHSPVGKPSLFQ